jgi:UDP-N-acetylmuramyl pentapeptide phosphotransferase/UDP-N-acetylglucosamine-1-phosphate transferase
LLELIAPLLSLPSAYVVSRWLCTFLRARGRTVPDAHKPGRPQVPRPGGPAIVAATFIGLTAVYALTGSLQVVAFALTVAVAFLVGLFDDLKSLKGPLKVGLVTAAALPILLLHTYTPLPPFPFSGHLRLTDLYPLFVLLAVPITANAFNMIDVYNGLVSGFSIIATIPLLVDFLVTQQYTVLAACLVLLLSTVGFYPFHRNPSRLFPGDSGSLSLGAAYGALAIIGHAEVVAVVALLPAVLNSFFVISSVGGLIEHREMKKRPVRVREDYKLEALRDKDAPVTLTRLVLADGPLTEAQITGRILLLEAFSSVLALITLALELMVP